MERLTISPRRLRLEPLDHKGSVHLLVPEDLLERLIRLVAGCKVRGFFRVLSLRQSFPAVSRTMDFIWESARQGSLGIVREILCPSTIILAGLHLAQA